MIKSKILVIAPYPIVNPIHGGQKRASALFKFYKNNFEDAKFAAVFHRGQYPEWGEDDLPLGDPNWIAQIDERPYASELISGEAIDKDIHVRSYMAKLLTEYRPDIIHVEQPFGYIGLAPLIGELQLEPLLIFGSQNIEYPLKERIFEELKVPAELANSLVSQTKELEYDFSRAADLVLAVNMQDAKTHKEMGAKNCIVVTNGIEKIIPSNKELEYWENYKHREKIKKIVTFVGSGHPPNWEGFLKMVGPDTSFMPKDAKIVVAGGVASYFESEFKNKESDAKFWSGVKLIGKVDDDRLAALIQTSDLIILPITTERGSNLKTAEAILSGKKFVATSNTFSGFERYKDLPNIFIADNQKKFQQSIVHALSAHYIEPNSEQRKLAETVQWEFCLQPILPAVRRMLLTTYFKKKIKTFKHKLVYRAKRALVRIGFHRKH